MNTISMNLKRALPNFFLNIEVRFKLSIKKNKYLLIFAWLFCFYFSLYFLDALLRCYLFFIILRHESKLPTNRQITTIIFIRLSQN